MQTEQNLLDDAVQFLVDGHEAEAANLLRTCEIYNWEIVDNWMDGARQLDGILIEIGCARTTYEVLTDKKDPRTQSIHKAFNAVLPSGNYLKSIDVKAVPGKGRLPEGRASIRSEEMNKLVVSIEAQKTCMIDVATGGSRIDAVNNEYKSKRDEIISILDRLGLVDPNPYSDLWGWYGKWSDGSLPSYQSRRRYIADLYQPLLDAIRRSPKDTLLQPVEPTGWPRVDRCTDKIRKALETAKNEEDFQAVGLLCREATISLAQAVYDPAEHGSLDGVTSSSTDAKRMLENYIAKTLAGESHDYHRKFARAAYDLAAHLQHRRTAEFRDATLCAEATCSLVNIIAVISGHRDPEK